MATNKPRTALGLDALSSLVYSTESGRTCPTCRQALTACTCRAQAAQAVIGDGRVRVGRNSKGRGGKVVSEIRGLPLAADALNALAKQLKALCGTGGTCKDGVIEIQGDHVDRLVAHLQQAGYAAKRTGG